MPPPLSSASSTSTHTGSSSMPKKTIILSPLISLLRSLSFPTGSQKDSLSRPSSPSQPLHLHRPRPPPVLFSYLLAHPATVSKDASAIIFQVACCYEVFEAFRELGGVNLLVRMRVNEELGSGRAIENTAAVLLNMAMCGWERVHEEVRGGGGGEGGG